MVVHTYTTNVEPLDGLTKGQRTASRLIYNTDLHLFQVSCPRKGGCIFERTNRTTKATECRTRPNYSISREITAPPPPLHHSTHVHSTWMDGWMDGPIFFQPPWFPSRPPSPKGRLLGSREWDPNAALNNSNSSSSYMILFPLPSDKTQRECQ